MVYNTQNYWVFGLFPSSGILETRKHDITETGSVSVLKCVGKTPTKLGSVIEVTSFQGTQLSMYLPTPHMRTETDSVSETSCFIVSRIPDDV
jgi:hypothetical protein